MISITMVSGTWKSRTVTKRPFKKRTIAGSIPNKVSILERKVRKINEVIETKHLDTALAINCAYDSDNTIKLASIAQGSTSTTRVGHKVSPMSLEIRGAIYQTSGSVPSAVRLMVVKSKQRFIPQTNANTPSSRVLQSQVTNVSIWDPFDYSNRSHFVVLYDKTFSVGFDDTVNKYANGRNIIPVHFKKSLNGQIVWEDNGVVDEKGQYYLLAYSTLAGVNVEAQFNGSCRLSFKDA